MAQIRRSRSGTLEFLRFTLVFLGFVLLLGGVALAIVRIVEFLPTLPAGQVFGDAALFAAVGVAMGAGLWGLAAALELLEKQLRQAHQLEAAMQGVRAALQAMEDSLRNFAADRSAAGGGRDAGTVDAGQPEAPPAVAKEAVEVLREVRNLMLMTEAQRAAAAREHWAGRKGQLLTAARQHLAAGRWAAVEDAMRELRGAFPGDSEVGQLAEDLASQRVQRMQGEIAAAREKIRHWMSISAWEQAEGLSAELERKYPGEPEAGQIREELKRERAALEREDVERLFLDLADATEHRIWRRAVTIADEIQLRFPSDRRSEKLRHDLGTIRENAAAQERKEQETLFKDLLKRQRYEEAIEVARDLIDKYPLSPAAAELINLLPKVEELLRVQRAGRAGPVA